MKNPIKMDDLGGFSTTPIFRNIHMDPINRLLSFSSPTNQWSSGSSSLPTGITIYGRHLLQLHQSHVGLFLLVAFCDDGKVKVD